MMTKVTVNRRGGGVFLWQAGLLVFAFYDAIAWHVLPKRLVAAGLVAISPLVILQHQPVLAFENALPNTYKMPKSPGPKPTKLGLVDGKLRACLKPSPNCFSTTPDRLGADDDDDDDDDKPKSMWGNDDIHVISRWQGKGSPDEVFVALSQALKAYVPGQGDIDGGGFEIITTDPKQRYLYTQFESLRRGYIDDLELRVDDDSGVQIVSSSRLGYLDFQVNAKRLNYLASQLRKKGFVADEITAKTHPVYFDSNHEVVRAAPTSGDGFGKKKY